MVKSWYIIKFECFKLSNRYFSYFKARNLRRYPNLIVISNCEEIKKKTYRSYLRLSSVIVSSGMTSEVIAWNIAWIHPPYNHGEYVKKNISYCNSRLREDKLRKAIKQTYKAPYKAIDIIPIFVLKSRVRCTVWNTVLLPV